DKDMAFAGQVLHADSQKGLVIELRHGLAVGDSCDFLTPQNISSAFILAAMHDMSGQQQDKMPPNRLMVLPYRDDVPVLSILRLSIVDVNIDVTGAVKV
ncbi:MAG: U32 family peptidase C-terminal domain-containing protein, partial [Planctomycetes bacterium]|nr:U32 family peptidase C-terminal domain-containing protein [Planctomycetota bacterium]